MKKILLTILIAVFLGAFCNAIVLADAVPDTLAESADPSDTTIDTAGNTTAGGGEKVYKELTCFLSGTQGTINIDIDGSLDGTTYYGMYDDITALGGYSVVDQPFIYYRLDFDTCTACAVTVKCIPVAYDANGK